MRVQSVIVQHMGDCQTVHWLNFRSQNPILYRTTCVSQHQQIIACSISNASLQWLSLRLRNLVDLSLLPLLRKRSALLSLKVAWCSLFSYRLSSSGLSFNSSLIYCWLSQSLPKLSYSSSVSHVANWRFCTFSLRLSSSSITLRFDNLFFGFGKLT